MLEHCSVEYIQGLRNEYAESAKYAREKVNAGDVCWTEEEAARLEKAVAELDAELESRKSQVAS